MEDPEVEALLSSSQTITENEVKTKSLKIWQTAAAVFMTAQAIIMFILPLDTSVPISIDFPDRKHTDGPVGVPSIKVLGGGLHVKYLIACFLLLSGVDHLCWSFVLWFQNSNIFTSFLQKTLFKRNNPLRWIEFFFSASLMSVLVASLSGVYSIHTLLLVAEMTGVTMLLGWFIELIPKGKQRPLALGLFFTSCFTCLAAWWPIFCYFSEAFTNSDKAPPGFVIVAFLVTFLAYCSFAVNFWLYYFSSLYSFHTSEVIYILLSFTAKTVLAWDVWGGFRASSS